MPRSKLSKIYIYTKGITYAAELLEANPERLKRVVRLHERAHALHHLGCFGITLVQNDVTEKNANKRYRKAPEEFKEQLAQLSVLLAIRTRIDKVKHLNAKEYLQNLNKIFFDLMDRQSQKYKLSNEIRGLSVSQLKYKLKLLFEMSDDGFYPTQDQIVRICCMQSDTPRAVE